MSNLDPFASSTHTILDRTPQGPTETQLGELRKAVEAARRHNGLPPDLTRLVNAAHAVVFEVDAYREYVAKRELAEATRVEGGDDGDKRGSGSGA